MYEYEGKSFGARSFEDDCAIAAMKALLSREDLQFLFKTERGGVIFNDHTVGPHGEKRIRAQDTIADLAYDIADAMSRKRKVRERNQSFH